MKFTTSNEKTHRDLRIYVSVFPLMKMPLKPYFIGFNGIQERKNIKRNVQSVFLITII